MPGDLHTHSTFSDGSLPAGRLPLLAARAGLAALAISDHDTLKSVQYAHAHPTQEGVELIPATELSARDPDTGRRVHLLAYWPQLCPALQQHCARLQASRDAACRQSAKELEEIYPQFSADMALAYAADSGVLFKSGIMQALCQLGLAESIYGDTYRRLFGQAGLVLHKPTYDTVDTVLDTMRQSRAAIVFAHPSVYQSMPLVRRLAAQGLLDGIEAEHPRNTAEDKAECLALCRQYGLVATGGSDFHGSNAGHPRPLGCCTTTAQAIERLKAIAASRQ